MSKDDARLERLHGMLRQRGILLPAFDLYGGAKGLYDFGPIGGRLRSKMNQVWKLFYIIRLRLDDLTLHRFPWILIKLLQLFFFGQ